MYPKQGQRVVIHYAKKLHPMPYHGQRGTVAIAGKGKPRNHLIQTDSGHRVTVPAGNINPVEATS